MYRRESIQIEELLDEGFISPELAAGHYYGNLSVSDKERLNAFLSDHPHHRCSVNQSQLAGWSWLIGKKSSGVLAPLLCITSKKDTCDAMVRHYIQDKTAIEDVFCVLSCLLGLASLVTLAIWCRFKAPKTVRPEVGIQLLLLRVFSGLDLLGPLLLLFDTYWIKGERTRVFSTFHAILVASFINAMFVLPLLCGKLKIAFNFLASIYLVEYSYSAQRVLLFVSERRTKILLVVSSLICSASIVPSFLLHGYLYCVNSSAAYVMHELYVRLENLKEKIHGFWMLHHIVDLLLALLTGILLAVSVLKRCCHCCRCAAAAPAPDTAVTVAYSRQVGEAEAETPPEPTVTIELEASVNPAFGIAVELRRLIFWHQAWSWIILCAILLLQLKFYISGLANNLYMAYYILFRASLLGYLGILSVILSPTYRRGFVSLFLELKDAATGFARSRCPESLLRRTDTTRLVSDS